MTRLHRWLDDQGTPQERRSWTSGHATGRADGDWLNYVGIDVQTRLGTMLASELPGLEGFATRWTDS